MSLQYARSAAAKEIAAAVREEIAAALCEEHRWRGDRRCIMEELETPED